MKWRLERLIDGGDLGYDPPSNCYGGSNSASGSSQSQQASQGTSQSNTNPLNFQNPAFVNQAPTTVSNLGNVVSQSAVEAGLPGFNGSTGNGLSDLLSSFVAPVTGAENNTLGSIGNVLGTGSNGIQGVTNALMPTLVNEGQNPLGFAQSVATSPQIQATIQAALQPIRQQFNSQTVPGLEGSFTQAGQRIGTEQGSGSSAFDNAFANAQGSELATEAATAGSIENGAFQSGLNMAANAPGQASALTSSELSNLISGLNAQTLPQLTQQLGINTGISTYNSAISTLMQALGLETQGEQPSLGYFSNSNSQESSSGTSSGQNSSSGFNISPFGGSSNGSGAFGFLL